MSLFDFSDQVVIVTGAAGNLGQAVARAFQAASATLVLVDHAPDRLPRLFPELAESGDHLLATSVDVTDAEAVHRTVDATIERFGRVDVLVNTVGGYRGGAPVHEMTRETWDYMLDLNARTVFTVCRAVIPRMRQQGRGSIVNVASRAALKGMRNAAAYSASKCAVVRLTESMAAELRRDGIKVNCVMPATIDTPQNRADMPKADFSRWAEPEAIADVILFLASQAARAVVGAAIPV